MSDATDGHSATHGDHTGRSPDERAVRQARDSVGGAIGAGVARDLSELARQFQAELDPQSVMRRIVAAAVAENAGADSAAITLLQHGRVSSPAHSSERAARVGLAQSETGEGPCVDTSRQEVTIRCDDLREESRWPEFAARALAEGVMSVLSLQLFVESDSMGALDVYSLSPHGLDAEAENTGLLLAAHAGVALAASRNQQNLRSGMDTRDLIGQAKGILMERYRIDGGRAFDLLMLSSQHTNTKLRDVADHLVATGEVLVPRPHR